jgi:D-sedoheptulose 7-phosphate isomerase
MAGTDNLHSQNGNFESLINSNFDDLKALISESQILLTESILEASRLILDAFQNGKKILIMGNGGSAADAQHFAGEFVSSFSQEISRRGLPAIALTTNSSIITAYANDFDFAGVFSRQVEALGRDGDVLIGISTSGRSRNCLLAFEIAKQLNLRSLALTRAGSDMEKMADMAVSIPSNDTQRIQEMHVLSFHMICQIVETAFVNGWEIK